MMGDESEDQDVSSARGGDKSRSFVCGAIAHDMRDLRHKCILRSKLQFCSSSAGCARSPVRNDKIFHNKQRSLLEILSILTVPNILILPIDPSKSFQDGGECRQPY